VSIHHYIASYGYLAVFALVLAESFGVPIPGETALIAAATYAGATHRLSVWLIFLVAATAAILGGTAGYIVGDKGGYHLLRRFGPAVHFDEPKIKVARYLFDRHGAKVIFFGRFISVLRAYASFLAGTVRMRFRTFAIANASGAIVWAAVYAFGFYFAGAALKSVSTPLDVALAAVAVAVIVVVVILVRRKMNSLVEVAEAAYPGPLSP
jgi:membrane protein DedA with SNARE-associated domain